MATRHEQDLVQLEHYYQNHLEQQQQQQHQQQNKIKTHQQQLQMTSKTPHLQKQRPQPGSYHKQHQVQNRITRHPSNSSSIMPDSDKKTCSFFVLILAVICQFLAVITICITFIFPFWILFQVRFPIGTLASTASLNLTNTDSLITLVATNSTTSEFPSIPSLDEIRFDMGLWEIKTYRSLQTIDLKQQQLGGVSASNSKSMRWTTDNQESNSYSFVSMYMSLINLASSNVFAIQILEILHLILTVFTFCATSVTLCLCTNKKASLAWYLVCYLLCIISFLLGLAVVIVLIAWQTATMPRLASLNTISVLKAYGFCFWLSVAVLVLLLISSFFLLAYIIAAAVSLYQKHRKATKLLKPKKSSNQNAANFTNLARIPRLQVNNTPTDNSENDNDAPINAFSNLQQMPGEQNASYVFYTGHGQFQHAPGHGGRRPVVESHPYSNVLVEQVNHGYIVEGQR